MLAKISHRAHLQDMGRLNWAKCQIRKAEKLEMFIHNHQFTQSLSHELCSKDLLKPAATCFGTNLIIIDHLSELKAGQQRVCACARVCACVRACVCVPSRLDTPRRGLGVGVRIPARGNRERVRRV